jgi:two-component system NarL family response regulator
MMEGRPGLSLLGTAANGQDLLRLIEEMPPQVVLIEPTMPGMSGAGLCKEILQNHPQVKVMALSVNRGPLLIEDMVDAGARGYLCKNVEAARIEAAVIEVAEGQGAYCPIAWPVVQRKLLGLAPRDLLSAREIEILRLVCRGLVNSEIGGRLFISHFTAAVHRRNIARKLNIHCITELMLYAMKNELIEGAGYRD